MSDLAEQLEKLARKDLQRIAKSIGVKVCAQAIISFIGHKAHKHNQ